MMQTDHTSDDLDSSESHVSDLALDRLMNGELDDAGRGPDPRPHLASCSACAARRDALARSREAFRALEAVRERSHGRMVDRLPRPVAPARRAAIWTAGLAAAAVLALVVGRGLAPPRPFLHAKGAFALEVFVKRASGKVAALVPSDPVQPGDALAFRASVPSAGFLGVLSIDGAGRVSSYFSGPDGALAPIGAGLRQPLDGSVVLDQVLGRELVIALLCPERRPLGPLAAALGAGLRATRGDATAIDLAAVARGCRHTTFSFEKVERR